VGGTVVAGVDAAPGATAGSSGTLLPPVVTPDAAGVGSNMWVQPRPSSQISGHACASWLVTWKTPAVSRVPGVKPTATRAGIPSDRAIAAYALANCTQKPCFSRRKATMALPLSAGSMVVSYTNPDAGSRK
jgi:hypothetical protein